MASEEEDYDIFSNLHEYEGLEMMRTNDRVGLADKLLCKSLGNKFEVNKDKIEKICKQFLQLCSYYDVWKTIKSFSHKHFCGIMNYWLNSDLKEINDKNKLKSDFYPSIMEESKKKLGKLDCTLNLHKIDDHEFKNLQILYELYDNFYKKIDTENLPKPNVPCKNVCIHKEKCAETFNSNIERCSSKTPSKFCEALKKFSKKYVEYEICHNCQSITQLKPYPIEEEAEKSVVSQHRDSARSSDTVTQESLVEPHQESSTSMGPAAQETDSHAPDSVFLQPPADSDTMVPQENSNIVKKLSHSVLAGATVLFTSSVLYRYTPIGTWIRRLRRNNQNIERNMEGFSSSTKESGHIFSENQENYIPYEPT
ncbi:Plasmodium vivax Vir protein, putative [Plasmodium vivax]|nr:Plasmodium vivax Vir protein, putative [Plasmodium vivax]